MTINRVEFPIADSAKIFSSCSTIGELKNKYKDLSIIKYIYRDPKDGKLKGVNPPNNIPLVPEAYITVVGEIDDIIALSEELTQV